eukprot:gene21699-22640_t
MALRAWIFGALVLGAGGGLIAIADHETPPRQSAQQGETAVTSASPPAAAIAAADRPANLPATWRIDAAAALTAWAAKAGLPVPTVSAPNPVHEFDQAWPDVAFVIGDVHGAIKPTTAEPAAAVAAEIAAISKHCTVAPQAVPEPVGAAARAYVECDIEARPRLFYIIAAPASGGGQYVLTLFGKAGADDATRAKAIGEGLTGAAKYGTVRVGVTSDLKHRLDPHRATKRSGFSGRYNPGRLVHVEPFDSTHAAVTREKELKNGTRAEIVALIERDNPDWDDLSGEVAT